MAIKFFQKKTKKQNGFALIFVMVFIALIMSIVAEIVYRTDISAKNTIVQEDALSAKMAARTGLEFAQMLLTLNKLAQNNQAALPVPIPKNFYSILNGQPIGAQSFQDISKLTGIDFSRFLSPHLLEGLKAVKGYFVITITSENTKLNLNLLQNTYAQITSTALLRLFSTPDTEKFLALYHYTPVQLVDNLSHYIKITQSGGLQDSSVLVDYRRLGFNYLPKHAALESLEELRRVPGFEVDEIYKMFSPYFTVWPLSGAQNSLNINSASPALLATLLTPLKEETDEKAWDKFEDYRLKNTFAQNNIGSWFKTNLQSFAQDTAADDMRKNILGVTDSIFRIECRGVVDSVEKKLVMVVQLDSSTGSAGQSAATGANVTPGANAAQGSSTGTSNTATTSGTSVSGSSTSAGASGATAPVAPGASTAAQSHASPFHIIYSQWVD